MDLNPLTLLGNGDRDSAKADAEFVLTTLIGEANASTDEEDNPIASGEKVTATKTYYGNTFAKVWRYLLEESVVISVPRNSFFANTSRMNWTVGTQDAVFVFDENANSITVETIKP